MKINDIYNVAIRMGLKANCFAFGGFASPESLRGNNANPGPAFKNC